jgi:hypothetical protein
MKDNIEKFVGLGGSFEVGIHCTDLLYSGKRMSIPNHFFTSDDSDCKQVLDYYLEMMPKLLDNKGPSAVVGFPEDLDTLEYYKDSGE